MSPTREVIASDLAPLAIGPYSQGIRFGHFIFTAGQVGIDRSTGELVAGGIEAQTRQALTNLRHVLQAGGSELSRVVKTTVFLKSMEDFAAMNAVYAEFLPAEPPARSTVAVAALPKGALVEIECIALAP